MYVQDWCAWCTRFGSCRLYLVHAKTLSMQKCRQTYIQPFIQTHTHTDIQTCRQTDIQASRHTSTKHRQTDMQTDRCTGIQTYKHRQTDRQKYTHVTCTHMYACGLHNGICPEGVQGLNGRRLGFRDV